VIERTIHPQEDGSPLVAVTVNPPTTAGASARELAAVAAGLAALIAGILLASDGGVLFTRPFWVDEWFTFLLTDHPSPFQVLGDLRAGSDGAASLYHLLVWLLHAVAGSMPPALMRALSLVLMFLALIVVYIVLRRVFDRDASLAGVLAAGSHALIVTHAFEGRFYALWLLTCALFAWTLSLNQQPSRRRILLGAVAAALVSPSHWYGVFTVAMMAGAVVLSYGRRWKEGLRVAAPAFGAVIMFIALLPLLMGQRTAITVDSWVPAFTTGQLRGLVSGFWTARVPLLAAGAVLIGVWLSVRRDRGRSAGLVTRLAAQDAGVVALFSLAAMPVLLTALSLAGQPSMLSRYALPAVLAWGPFVAFAVTLLGRWPARIFAIVLVSFWWTNFEAEIRRKRAFAVGVTQEARMAREAQREGLPVVFQSLHTMYPAVAAERSGAPAVFLDLPDSTLEALFPDTSRWYQLNKGIWLERDFARVHAVRLGFPTLMTQAELDSTDAFLLVATAARMPRGMDDISALARAEFPHHRIVPVTANLLRLERPNARNRPARSTSR
jgi:hypothetical protein